MSKSAKIEVSKLNLDLKNYRTVPQKNEIDAIKAMISIKAEKFYGIMESMIQDGYIPTENIIVLEDGGKYTVMEGNRRVACLKIIHGIHDIKKFTIKSSIISAVSNLNDTWKKDNTEIPCTIYKSNEMSMIDKIISLTHGKGEQASRDKWGSVATARHNREVNKEPEPALDILEKYLKYGKNLNALQKERWAGDYPLTVLDEGLKHLYARLGFNHMSDLVKQYPKTEYSEDLDRLMYDIGILETHTRDFRNETEKFVVKYGAKPTETITQERSNNITGSTSASSNATSSNGSQGAKNTNTSQTTSNNSSTPTATKQGTKATSKSYSINDPRNVTALLKKFKPKAGRPKVVTLRDELINTNINKTPIAFCFVLRSMFEISAKLYCKDNSISLRTTPKDPKKNPQDKTLSDLLKDSKKHIITNSSIDKDEKTKALHGATIELTRTDGILGVRSMNQLVHSDTFNISPNDICTLFSNVFPLLDAMNK